MEEGFRVSDYMGDHWKEVFLGGIMSKNKLDYMTFIINYFKKRRVGVFES